MVRTSTPTAPRPARGPQRRRRGDDPGPRARWPTAGGSLAAAVLGALSAEPGGATVAVIAARAGISTAAARQTLLAHEKNGTATRVKGSRPGISDTWTPAAPEAPRDEARPPRSSARAAAPTPGGPQASMPTARPTSASLPQSPLTALLKAGKRKSAPRRDQTRR